MNRGANHQLVFLDDQDRRMFLAILAEAVDRFGIEIHAYCLMPNHYHLLVRSPNTSLSRAMKHIGQVYTQRFNKRHHRDGALFRGRFHSILVDSDTYLDNVSRYIHRNPIVEGMDASQILDRFDWSSFSAYEGRVRIPAWLTLSEVLARFRDADAYSRFVRSNKKDRVALDFYSSPFGRGRVLGDRRFVETIGRRSKIRVTGLRPFAP